MKDMIHKFKFKEDPIILYTPDALKASVAEMVFQTAIPEDTKSTNTLVFVNSK